MAKKDRQKPSHALRRSAHNAKTGKYKRQRERTEARKARRREAQNRRSGI